MSGLDRYMAILRLFTETTTNLTVTDMSRVTDVPASTIYRTVRELVAEGFLEPSTEGHYRLGAAFVEYDRLVRLTDPLVKFGTPVLRDVASQTKIPAIAVLARLYRNRVICAANAMTDGTSIRSSYEQGRPMPLTRGATSKVILAQLPARRFNKLLERVGPGGEPAPALPLPEFRAELATIRKKGFSVTRGEVDAGLVGLAVPIHAQGLAIVASLSFVVEARHLDEATERRLVMLLVSSSGLLIEALERFEHQGATSGAWRTKPP
jgi:DNA-binding IclR family transcriptional regulator